MAREWKHKISAMDPEYDPLRVQALNLAAIAERLEARVEQGDASGTTYGYTQDELDKAVAAASAFDVEACAEEIVAHVLTIGWSPTTIAAILRKHLGAPDG